MSRELQALCFLAGANSMFIGGKLLTTPLPGAADDASLMHDLGMRPMGTGSGSDRRRRNRCRMMMAAAEPQRACPNGRRPKSTPG